MFFYVQIFHMNIVLAAFSSYILALAKNLYKKCARKTLMKLTTGADWKEGFIEGKGDEAVKK